MTDWLRASSGGAPTGVDRENKVIRGYVVAQKGHFKSEGRGQFDDQSLAKIVELMNSSPIGLKSRLAHPTECDDGVGKFLGRAKNARLADGGTKVRADLHLDPSSFQTPAGDLGSYLLSRAESDPESLSSSLVLRTDKIQILDEKGRPAKDENGRDIPPIWRPKSLHASDVVDTGDAVDGFLSVEHLPDGLLWKGAALLDRLFSGQDRASVEKQINEWLSRYLSHRYGEASANATSATTLRRRLRLREFESR